MLYIIIIQKGDYVQIEINHKYYWNIYQLLVKQTVELFEAFTGFETANKYKVATVYTVDYSIDSLLFG